MKKVMIILLCALVSSASAWAIGPRCGPVPRLPSPVYVRSTPTVIYTTRAPRAYYATPAPMVYSSPAYCTAPSVRIVATWPLFSCRHGGYRHHGGGCHR